MNSNAAAAAYQESAVESAPPLKIIHMLYEGALRFLAKAEACDPASDPQGFGGSLRRADAIVCELRLSLNPDQAPELAQNLSALYLFVEGQIQEALLEQAGEPIAPAREVLETLFDGWKHLDVTQPETAA